MKRFFPILMVTLLALTACEQKVDIALDESASRVVIEGWVTDVAGPYDFKVTKTGAYLGDRTEILVPGAFMVLKDDMGNADTLIERRPGWYQATHMRGQVEHNYFLEATVEGKLYKASNYMPRINDILASGYEYNDSLIFGAGYYVGMLAQEPAGIGDYYQFRFWRNDTAFDAVSNILVTDDRLVDGQLSPFLFPYPCRLGDTVVIEVRSLSLSSYDFFVTLVQQGSGTGGPFASVPDNLATNFDNNALGWFGAAAPRRDTLVIQ